MLEIDLVNRKLKKIGARIEWRPKLRVYDAFRFVDSSAPPYMRASFRVTTPRLRTPDFFEACCFAMSPHHRQRSGYTHA